MTGDTRIVVGMSVYNEAAYLDETIPALLAQTMPDFHAIIVDNGSTDDSWAILQGYRDARLTLIRSPKNLAPGIVSNLVWGVALDVWRDCRWFLHHGADDLMAPDYFDAILTAAAERPDVNLIFSPWQWIGHPERGVKRFPDYDPETVHAVHQIPAWHAFARELRASVGDQHEGIIAADWDWIVRASMSRMLRPYQLDRPYLSLRVRDGDRKSQSDEVHWPELHRHLCQLVGKPVPEWAQ